MGRMQTSNQGACYYNWPSSSSCRFAPFLDERPPAQLLLKASIVLRLTDSKPQNPTPPPPQPRRRRLSRASSRHGDVIVGDCAIGGQYQARRG
jgi:hypothetical protein